MIIHICVPKPVSRKISRRNCPDCGKRAVFVSVYYEWYGSSSTCLNCGRAWQDGEWMPLAFYRYARRDNIKSAKAEYRRAEVEARVKEGTE